jgi:type II secretory pathway predicted ATPase ExeA
MYCDYFGFSEKPFDVTPDPRFLFMTPDHRETLASLIYGIQERRGFITVVGEVGTGKTTLLHAAMDRMDEKTQVAFIFNTDVTFNEMLNMALYDWGLTEDIKKLSKVEAIQRLNRFAIDQLSKGGNVVLILDEAHILSRNAMENLRLLSNLETRKHKLIQIILSGQPELDTKLDRHELRQLAQRINLRRYIYPLNKTCTFSYLRHRLSVVTNSDSLPFDNKAEKMIWEYSGGIPRKINMLCDNALLIGYGLGKKKIDGTIIQEAAKDLKWDRFSKTNTPLNYSPIETESTSVEKKPPRRFLKLAATVVITGILVTAGSFIMNKKEFQLPELTNFLITIKDAVIKNAHQDNERQNRINPTGYRLLKETFPKEIETPRFIASKKLAEEDGIKKYKIIPDALKSDYNDKITEDNKAGVSISSPENSLEPELSKEMTQATIETIDTFPSNLRQGIYVTVPVTEKTTNEIQASAQIPSEIKTKAPSSTVALSDLGQNKSMTIPSSDLKRGEIQMSASKHVQIYPKPKTPDTLKNTEIEQDESDASSISSDKQATILAAKPLVNPLRKTVHPEKDLSEENKVVYKERTQLATPRTDDNKAATRADKKTVFQSATTARSETTDSAGFDHSNLHARLKSFLNEYCRIYEQKDLNKLSNFFALNAVEKGKPFKFWFSKYRQNFNRVNSIEYDIEIERYATQQQLGLIRIDGIFHVRFKMADSKEWRKNSGQISMVLEADENSFNIRQLDY